MPDLDVTFVCDKAFEAQSRGIMKHAEANVRVKTITAGKLRRYHGIVWWKQLFDIPTTIRNLRDVLYVAVGVVQGFLLLLRNKPHVVFAKGGYVCLPMGIAAKFLRIPIVIHDSDTRPGLTNRVLGRWAAAIATGAPLHNYHYPREISYYTGVPIEAAFHPFTAEEQRAAKAELGVSDLNKPLIVVTGGGLGAKSINDAISKIAVDLLSDGVAIYHVTGMRQHEELVKQAHHHADYQLVPFVYKDMAHVLGAADVVIARGSATFLQELAALAKPVIVVPAQHLGDQVKNAHVFELAEAALVLSDEMICAHPQKLYEAISLLLTEPAEAHHIAQQLHTFAKPQAAIDVAGLIAKVGSRAQPQQITGGNHEAIS